ncbi:hypothetical protein [Novosphingobium sp.]|uniref:hypothetical protein n=1 Tax=Novosphingobium sp. TaxID=1874826 RepID=UPI0031E40508
MRRTSPEMSSGANIHSEATAKPNPAPKTPSRTASAVFWVNVLFAAGADFTIADIAHFGWIWRRAFVDIDLAHYPHG